MADFHIGGSQSLSWTSVESPRHGPSKKTRNSGSISRILKFWKKDRDIDVAPKQLRGRRGLPLKNISISSPLDYHHVSGTSKQLIGASIEERARRAAALSPGITRHSALGSHSPFEPPPQVEQVKLEFEAPLRILHRRATLPKMVDSSEHFPQTNRENRSRTDVHNVNPADIGFAVTSGSNFLKRRSRSANALYTSTKAYEGQLQVRTREERRRSDEIRYWRASVCPSLSAEIVAGIDAHDYAEKKHLDCSVMEPRALLPETSQKEIIGDPEAFVSTTDQEIRDRDTFNFGSFATEMQKQDQVSIERRIITLEVKLMDLEYAVSKLQKPSNTLNTTNVPRTTPGNESIAASRSSRVLSDTATNISVSTQPTNISLNLPEDPFTPAKAHTGAQEARILPISPPVAVQPSASRQTPRDSSNTVTIDQLDSLIGLVRREQAARHSLEDQVVELQRDMKALRQQVHPPPLPTTLFSRQRDWSHAARSQTFDDETDDGFQDVYETPTEVAARSPEFHGAAFFERHREGAAF